MENSWKLLANRSNQKSLTELCIAQIRKAIMPITEHKLKSLGLPLVLQKAVSHEDIAEKIMDIIMKLHSGSIQPRAYLCEDYLVRLQISADNFLLGW